MDRVRQHQGDRIKIVRMITRLDLGGAQQSVLHLCRQLDPSLFEQVLITGEGGLLFDEPNKISALKHYVVPELTRSIGLSAASKDFQTIRQMQKIIRKESPDIVHTHTPKAGTIGRWAGFLAGVPKIVHTFHGFGFGHFTPFLSRFFFLTIERLNSLISDQLVFVSQKQLDQAIRWRLMAPQKGRLIRSGVDFSSWPPPIEKKVEKRNEWGLLGTDKIVGIVASMTPAKALHYFIEVAQKIAQNVGAAKFLMVGDGPLRDQLEREIRNRHLMERFILTGWRKDVPDLLRTMDVLLLTSLWEGVPKALIEATHAGIPVVAFDVEGVSEIIQDECNGFLIPAKDTDQMAQKTIQLLSNAVLREKMGRSGMKLAEPFCSTLMLAQHQKLYGDLISIS